MRVLLALILACNIYFSYMIYEILKLPKFNTVKTAVVNVPNNYIIISINGVANGSKSYKERNHYSDIYVESCHRSDQQFTANRSAKVKTNKKSMPQRYYCKSAGRDSHLYERTNASRIYRRKLLSHERIFRERPARLCKSHRMHREIKAAKKSGSKKRYVAKNTESSYDEDADSEAWDNWNNWSACSVTCGRGRQVRWRHCTSESCIKGLKKAQLKNCRLKDCNSKNFLEWLGIKTRST